MVDLTSPEWLAQANEEINRAPGMGCPANEGGEHSPGTGRSWRECNDCDVWPYAEPPPEMTKIRARQE